MKTKIIFLAVVLLILNEAFSQKIKRKIIDTPASVVAMSSDFNTYDLLTVKKEKGFNTAGEASANASVVRTNRNAGGSWDLKKEDGSDFMVDEQYIVIGANSNAAVGDHVHKVTSGTIPTGLLGITELQNSFMNNNLDLNCYTSHTADNVDDVDNEYIYNLVADFLGTNTWFFVANQNAGISVPLNAEFSVNCSWDAFYKGEFISTAANIDASEISVSNYSYWFDISGLNVGANDFVIIESALTAADVATQPPFEYSVYNNQDTGNIEIHWELSTFPGSGNQFPIGRSFDMWVIPEGALSVSEVSVAESVKVFPNPVKNIFTLKAKNTISNISVFSVFGQKINAISGKGSNTLQLDISSFASGYYIAKVQIGESLVSIKLIKE